MSDAHSDIARDKERLELHNKFLEQLVVYLKDRSPENLAELQLRAKATDDIPRGFRDGSTRLVAIFNDARLGKLVEKDSEEWELLLEVYREAPTYRELLALSPFVN